MGLSAKDPSISQKPDDPKFGSRFVSSMKMSELLAEMPYLNRGEMTRENVVGYMSANALDTRYTYIGHDLNIYWYLCNDLSHLSAVDTESKTPDSTRLREMFRLRFKESDELRFTHKFAKVLQINSVSISPDYGNRGTGSRIYQSLANRGYTLVSDTTQFEPAKSLWKKLAQIETVFVADVDYGLFKDAGGLPIVYDGANIADADIWSEGSNFDGNYRVLILQGKHNG